MLKENVKLIYGNYFTICKRLFNVAGINLYQSKNVVEAVRILVYSLTFLICVSIARDMLTEKHKELEIIYSLGLIIAYVVCLSINLKRKQLIKVFEMLEGEIFLPDVNRGGEEEVKSMQDLVILMDKIDAHDNEKNDAEWNRLQKLLKDVVTYHSAILNVSKLIDEAFHLCHLVKFLSVSILLCLLVYGMSTISVSDGLFWIHIVYAIFFLLVTNIVYYFGNEITIQSQEIGYCCYNLQFVGVDIRFQKGLLLIIQRSQRPIQMTVGKFFPLSLATSIAIVPPSACVTFFVISRSSFGQTNLGQATAFASVVVGSSHVVEIPSKVPVVHQQVPHRVGHSSFHVVIVCSPTSRFFVVDIFMLSYTVSMALAALFASWSACSLSAVLPCALAQQKFSLVVVALT
ncbi:hypothetical protein FQR65_LT01900 [Abscondita terminalis]|nr:hypothetical protein FQR65_LT01900 [Abscondita terminalis]